MKIAKLFQTQTSLQNALQFAESHIERLQASKRMVEKQIEVWEKKKESLKSQIKNT
jgi:chromosome segregation ATPase